jgi:hypothetical protein
MKMRASHVASSLRSRPADSKALERLIVKKYGWSPAGVIAKRALKLIGTQKKRGQTTATSILTVDQVEKIAERVASHDWDGLQTVNDLPGRGRGVLATRMFEPNEVVCDYGGKLLTHKDGKKKYETSDEDAMGFMFSFIYLGQKLWRDATEETQQHGRLINHSKCHSNVS